MRPVSSLVLFWLCLSCASVFAQNQVHLCVGILEGAGSDISGTVARDNLIKFLNKQKPDKNSPVTVETVPIDAFVPEQGLAEAKQKNCEFVVTTKLVELHTESSYAPGVGGTNVSTPKFFVTVSYRLAKSGDGSEVSSGSFKAQDSGSPQNAAAATLNKIAGKVIPEVRKAATTMAK